jgi:hypothetical protein
MLVKKTFSPVVCNSPVNYTKPEQESRACYCQSEDSESLLSCHSQSDDCQSVP